LTDQFDVRQYWERRLGEQYSLAGVGYLRLGRQYNAWMYRIRARVFSRLVAGLGLPMAGKEVLDIGSGTGFYVDQWRQLGVARVTGLDITQVAVDALGLRFPDDRFYRADIGRTLPSDLPLAPGSFTAVSAMDVLFHIVEDTEYATALSNIARLLAPGGWFIWSDNFLRHGTERVPHQASRSLADSERLVRQAGFEIVDRVPMFVLMNYPADTRSRLARLGWTAMVAPAAVAEPLGWLVGAALYPLERWLTATCRESWSTEIMICRKPAG
jgi:SAM-dependent methyltransferase